VWTEEGDDDWCRILFVNKESVVLKPIIPHETTNIMKIEFEDWEDRFFRWGDEDDELYTYQKKSCYNF